MWKDTGVYQQDPEVDLTVFHTLAHKALTAPGSRAADVPAEA